MALKEYSWHGHTWQIEDADLHLYPGAEPVPAKAARPAPDKAAKPAANKSRAARRKAE